jgi:hypothetical protein
MVLNFHLRQHPFRRRGSTDAAPAFHNFACDDPKGEGFGLGRPALVSMNFWGSEFDGSVTRAMMDGVSYFLARFENLAFAKISDHAAVLMRVLRIVRVVAVSDENVVHVEVSIDCQSI